MNVIDKIFQGGVVGAGGAGFPAHVKFNGVAEFLLVNAAECEPLLETDKFLIRCKSQELIKTIEILGKQIQAKKIIIGLKKKNSREVQALKEAILKTKSSVELHLVENFYPAGDEQTLVYEVTKRQIPPGGIPKDVGVVVCNVGTVINVYDALRDKPVINKFVTVLGEVNNPIILEVPIGTSIAECIKMANGVKVQDYKVILGGPMMGKIVDKGQVHEEVVTKTTGAFIVLPKEHYIFKIKEQSFSQMVNRSRSACIQCSLCTDLCPRYLIGHPLRPHRIMRTLSIDYQQHDVLKEALLCCECGVCEIFACPMGLSPCSINIEIKSMLRKEGIKNSPSLTGSQVNLMRENRKVPAERLLSRLDLTAYSGKISDQYITINSSKVKIPLRQHIGISVTPIVQVGNTVKKGQLIAMVGEGDLGANIHSSIEGVIKKIDEYIWIEEEEKVVKK